jgi:hypothetical protein
MFTRDRGYWGVCQAKRTNFFNKLHNSQREDWYNVTIYVAEFWCTVSNIPFLVVGTGMRRGSFCLPPLHRS